MRTVLGWMLVLGLLPAAAAADPTPDAVRAAVGKALPNLWTGMDGHSARRSCFTCHNHAFPLVALGAAKAKGFAVDADELRKTLDFLTEYWDEQRPRLAAGRGPGPVPSGGGVANTGWALVGYAAVGHKPDANTAAMADYALAADRRLGHWRAVGRRPPTEGSVFATAYANVAGLAAYAPADRKADADERTALVLLWLRAAEPQDTEDRVYRLLALHAAGAEKDDIRAATKELLATQRADGGWGQLETLASDAYATGTALNALQATGTATADPAYVRGVKYLLDTQKADGTWHVRTRSRPIQTYFETGFPYEKDQFISTAATAWATVALTAAVPAPTAR